MGVFVDKSRTQSQDAPDGVAIGLLWTENYGEAPTIGEQFVYSYPITSRAGRRDENEINAVKAAQTFDLPVFLIDAVSHNRLRHVRIAWVSDHDDEQRAFLLSFLPPISLPIANDDSGDDFALSKTADDRKLGASLRRPGQPEFSFRVFQRYGVRCALCNVSHKRMLEAAHLKPASLLGADDAKNGLVLCRNHHAALDAGLFVINHITLEVEVRVKGVDLASLSIDRSSIAHLRKKPHPLRVGVALS